MALAWKTVVTLLYHSPYRCSKDVYCQRASLLFVSQQDYGYGKCSHKSCKAPSILATMSKQHCRTLQVERFFSTVSNVASTLLLVWTGPILAHIHASLTVISVDKDGLAGVPLIFFSSCCSAEEYVCRINGTCPVTKHWRWISVLTRIIENHVLSFPFVLDSSTREV